jgi:hypothetical protein
LSLLQLVRALVAIPLVATGGIGTGAVSQRCWSRPRQALTPSADEASAGAEPDDPPDRPRCRAGLVPEGVLLLLGRELDAFRAGS